MEDKNCKPIGVKNITDIAIDPYDTVPDAFLVVRNIYDSLTGTTYPKILRAAGSKVMPNGNYDNVIVVDSNNTAIEVPENQVRAGYMRNAGSAYILQYADTTHNPEFLMLGTLAGQMMIQNTGFIDIPNGHSYVVGQRYYVGENGIPTTSPASGFSLFIPISSTRLAVELKRVSMTGLDGISISANASTTAAANTDTEIPLSNSEYTIVGTGLVQSNNRVEVSVGSGITAVEVSGSFYMSGSATGNAYIEIVRNIGGDTTNQQVLSRAQIHVDTASAYSSYALAPKVANVSEGDTISMHVYPGAPTMTVGTGSYITVKQLA